jgi:eukaryotic-like serine/threonine-protein kinase
MPLTAGVTLGPYEILARAGAVGTGEVCKARDTRLNRTVAIKVLPAALTADPDARQRLDREAKAVAALSHPHICSLFDIGHQDGTDFLVMEFLEGETLAERLTRGKLPIDEALRTGIQIADALATAHKAGIIHRDLKPGNIMLTTRGATLLDFGLAKPPPVALSAGMTQVATSRSPARGHCSARSNTWRLSSCRGCRPTHAPTSSPSGACCTRWSRADARLPGTAQRV